MMLKDSVEESIIALESSIQEYEEGLAQDAKSLKDMVELQKLYVHEEVLQEAIGILIGTLPDADLSILEEILNEIITAIDELEEEYI